MRKNAYMNGEQLPSETVVRPKEFNREFAKRNTSRSSSFEEIDKDKIVPNSNLPNITPEIMGKLQSGFDVFAAERACQNEIFMMLYEMRELEARIASIKNSVRNKAKDLENIRGNKGGVPTLENVHLMLRFIPEVGDAQAK